MTLKQLTNEEQVAVASLRSKLERLRGEEDALRAQIEGVLWEIADHLSLFKVGDVVVHKSMVSGPGHGRYAYQKGTWKIVAVRGSRIEGTPVYEVVRVLKDGSLSSTSSTLGFPEEFEKKEGSR